VSPVAGNTVITVRINEAEIEHRVRVRDFEAWLERGSKSPGEMVRRQRIRDRLKPKFMGLHLSQKENNGRPR